MANFLDPIDPDFNLLGDYLITDPTNNDHQSSCKYYTLAQYNDCHQSSTLNCSLINYNIRSFHANGDNFNSFLETNQDSLPDFIILSETWNTPNNVQLCNIDGYTSHHAFRAAGSRGGGISVLCKKKNQTSQLLHSECSEHIESCIVKVKFNYTNVIIVGIYRPPSGSIDVFCSKIENILRSFDGGDLVIVSGDININLTDVHSNQTTQFTSMMYSLHYLPTIDQPTRFGNTESNTHSLSTLDHIWVNQILPLQAGIIYYDATDHCPTFLKFYCHKTNQPESKTITFRPFSEQNMERLMTEIRQTDWNAIIGDPVADLDRSCDSFTNYLNNLYTKNFPTKKKTISFKRISKPWINSEIKKLINLKSEYYKLYRENSISSTTNNQIKNKVNKIVKKCKDQYYLNLFNTYRKNTKKSWDLIQSLIGCQNRREVIQKLVIDDNTYTDPTDIAEKFIQYFGNIATDLDSKLPSNDLSPLHYISPISNSLFLNPITPIQCSLIIRKLKNTKSDINVMPVRIFSALHSQLSNPLSLLINTSFSLGYFPKSLKLARITPVHKQGPKENPSNYRPISSLPYLSKVFEKSMTNNLISFLDKFSIISKSQFGFQKNISTSDALVHLTELIYKSLDHKKHHISILIDLKKAFDTMNHNILLRKLELYGIRHLPLMWIESYLRDRPSCVGLGGANISNINISNIGIPQGSIIGPILFLIYINDLPNISTNINTTLFADDTTISISDNSFNDLIQKTNTELAKIHDWTISNRLTINVDKTETLLFTNRPNDNNGNCIQLNETDINFTPSCKFLGTFIDNKLTFSKHINHILGKLSRGAGILYKIKDQLPTRARINYYYGMLYPFLSYNILVWGSTYETHITPLILQQKRIIRTITDAAYLDHTSPLFKNLEILKVRDIYRFQLLVHTYKDISNKPMHYNHDINTRNQNTIRSDFHRLTLTQHAVSYMGPSEWIKLPLELRSVDSLDLFKKRLKKYLIKDYDTDFY